MFFLGTITGKNAFNLEGLLNTEGSIRMTTTISEMFRPRFVFAKALRISLGHLLSDLHRHVSLTFRKNTIHGSFAIRSICEDHQGSRSLVVWGI